MLSPKQIAVIGAGPSGLTAIKSCKEEGMVVTCYEKTEHFGGRWRYRPISIPGVASVMKSAVSIHSKEMSAFSDFPPPKNFPNYFHHTKMLEYLRLYAQHFDLIPHIQFQKEVTRITPAPCFSDSGKWCVTSLNTTNGTKTTEVFDGIMVCTGRTSHPFIPKFLNQEVFKGRIIHTQELKDSTIFENLKVLIVGNGNSAMDAAVDISTLAEQVYLSTRNGTWILPRLGPKGFPFDMTLVRRPIHVLKEYFGGTVNNFVERYIDTRLQHHLYKLKPNNRALDKNPIINDVIPDKILTGRVFIKGTMARFEENGVVFEGDEEVTEVDVVILGTGYEVKLPFLGNELPKNTNGRFVFYKQVFPISLKHSSLAIIGFVESQGPLGPLSEIQSRWASRIFSKKLSFSVDATEECGPAKVSTNRNVSDRLLEDYIDYMDDIATELGAKPNSSALLFKDPYLYWMCLTGALLPYQYRITGPHSWQGAREAILESSDRITAPFSTRCMTVKEVEQNTV